MSDTLTALRTALAAPKVGMRRLPFPLESYVHPSAPLSAKRLLNYYAEAEPGDARTVAALIATPGRVEAPDLTMGVGPIRALNSDRPGMIYGVSGTHFYRLYSPALNVVAVVDLGDIGSVAGTDYDYNLMVTIAVGTTAAVVCVPPNAFTCTHDGSLNQIGGDFPGARSVAHLDGYYVFTSDDQDARVFTSQVLDPTMFDALDFFYADAFPNTVRRVMALRGDLWIFGDGGNEVWYDSGEGDFPFRRQPGAIIPRPLYAMKSVAEVDGSLFWVTKGGVVLRSRGYQVERVSDHALEDWVRQNVLSITSTVGYEQNGHAFYCITAGTKTVAYDCATKQWADRSSDADGSGPWRVTAVARYSDQVVCGSADDGRLFFIQPRISDDGVDVKRQAIMPPLWANTHRAFMNRLEIEMEVGGALSPGDVLVDWSDDGGITFRTPARVLNAGTITQLRKRVYTTRLGSFRQRVLRITTQGQTTLYAVDADITAPQAGG